MGVYMNIYSFTLLDDLLGWDITETYVSDAPDDVITSLWNATANRNYSDRISFIKSGSISLGYKFDGLKITKGFSM